MHRLRTVVVRVVAGLVIIGCLAASPLSIWLAWGVLYPNIDEIDATETFDAIVVLSGEDRRIERGLELAEAGRAPVLVAMYGEMWAGTRDKCGTKTTYETLCPVPPEDSTRGEVKVIEDLILDEGWKSVIVITSDYHSARLRRLLTNCLPGSLLTTHSAIHWDKLSLSVLRRELLKNLVTILGAEEC